jgi:hypothetical protein
LTQHVPEQIESSRRRGAAGQGVAISVDHSVMTGPAIPDHTCQLLGESLHVFISRDRLGVNYHIHNDFIMASDDIIIFWGDTFNVTEN